MNTTTKPIGRTIYEMAFSFPRTPRSDAYKAGVRYVLETKLDGRPKSAVPYKDGTAEADAYYSGCDEGHRRANAYLNEGELPS